MDFNGKKLVVEEAAVARQESLALTAGKGVKGDGTKVKELSEVEGKRWVKGRTFELGYDKLVVAVGCYSQTFNTRGVKENALFLKDVGDARKIRKRILDCMFLFMAVAFVLGQG